MGNTPLPAINEPFYRRKPAGATKKSDRAAAKS
jgi:hypothetical protein